MVLDISYEEELKILNLNGAFFHVKREELDFTHLFKKRVEFKIDNHFGK